MDLEQIFMAGGTLSAGLLNFEPREGQRAMAEAVALVLTPDLDEEHPEKSSSILVVEAETGIGKTLAYLIPAVLSGKRVVVSTATLNLQDQIYEKDIPLVARILGQDIPALCLKGRQNYLCLYRWYQYRSNPQLSLFAEPWVVKIDSWLQTTVTGDRAELDWLGEKSPFWPKVSCHSNQCLGGDCPELAGCFINQLRKQAGSCRLIVVNHHLFFSDLALRKSGFGEVLPRYEAVIFDEAHHLENVASTFFGKNFSHYQLIDLLGDIELQAKAQLRPEAAERLLPLQSGLKQRADAFTHIFPLHVGRYHLESLIAEISSERWVEEIELLSTGITRLADCLKALDGQGEGWLHLASRAQELNSTLREIALLTGQKKQEYVYWYEKRERSVALAATPIKIAEELRENLYASVNTCVLTSATLSSGGTFAYIKERLGLDNAVESLQLRSPFDYVGRTLLYIPEAGFPEPAAENYAKNVCTRILELLHLSEGRALILCTSYKGMDALAAFLDMHLDYPILVQGTASRNSLLRTFREETHSVLLATASFWEGVDVVGEALSCVIIDKLPFEVPSDPVIQARIARTKEEGGNPFFDFQVPRAILALRQGVGRLMRSSADRGVIAIMDVRLFTKGYGKTFLKSLPASPQTRDLKDIADFFKKADTSCPVSF
ncbi:MAG: ATP-dependent DNA helicase [Pseudomonadota bacterium]